MNHFFYHDVVHHFAFFSFLKFFKTELNLSGEMFNFTSRLVESCCTRSQRLRDRTDAEVLTRNLYQHYPLARQQWYVLQIAVAAQMSRDSRRSLYIRFHAVAPQPRRHKIQGIPQVFCRGLVWRICPIINIRRRFHNLFA